MIINESDVPEDYWRSQSPKLDKQPGIFSERRRAS